jgi:hypothetical protein
MILRLLCAKVVMAKLALTAAFTVGAAAGAAAVLGSCAARKAISGRLERDARPPAA